MAFVTGGEDGLDAIRELVASAAVGHARRARARPTTRADAIREMLDDAVSYPDLANWERITVGRAAVTPEDVETFERCIAVGGVALFPADTVYGLATEPDSREGVERLYRLKGRAAATSRPR